MLSGSLEEVEARLTARLESFAGKEDEPYLRRRELTLYKMTLSTQGVRLMGVISSVEESRSLLEWLNPADSRYGAQRFVLCS